MSTREREKTRRFPTQQSWLWFVTLLLLSLWSLGCQRARFSFDDLAKHLDQPNATFEAQSFDDLRILLRGKQQPRDPRFRRSVGTQPSFHEHLLRIGLPEGFLHRITAFLPLTHNYRIQEHLLRDPKASAPHFKHLFTFPLHPCYEIESTRDGHRLTLPLLCTSEGSGNFVISFHGWNAPQAPYREVIFRFLTACDKGGACVSGRIALRLPPIRHGCQPPLDTARCPLSLLKGTLLFTHQLTYQRAKQGSLTTKGGFALDYREDKPSSPLRRVLFPRQKGYPQKSLVIAFDTQMPSTSFTLTAANGRFLCQSTDGGQTGACHAASSRPVSRRSS